MTLELDGVGYVVGAQTYIHPTDLHARKGHDERPARADLSGKTTLMRLMAGLDVPTRGGVRWNGADVTGMRVQDRKVAMVYQQFINYPSMTRLRQHRLAAAADRAPTRPRSTARVRETAELLKLTPHARPQAAGTLGRPAAALRARPRAGQGRRARAARRAAGQPRLQAARGTARRDPAASSRSRARSSSMPRPSRRRRCCWAATPRPCAEGRITQFGPTTRGLSPTPPTRPRRGSSPIRR